MAEFKGGRGKRVTYETQMYRIPTPLRPTVEKLGMQFRLLWDGLADPKGEKLISRIEIAIPDIEQLAESNGHNQISGNGATLKPDSKYEGDTEEKAEQDEPDQSDEQTIRDQAEVRSQRNDLLSQKVALTAGTAEMSRYLTDAHAESDSLRLQLADIKNACTIATEDANRWNQLAVERLAEIERLRSVSQTADPEIAKLRSQLAALAEKVNADDTGFRDNAFTQGLKKLKGILEPMGIAFNPVSSSQRKSKRPR